MKYAKFFNIITNKINGKQYVGQTSLKNPYYRFQEHIKSSNRFINRPLYKAFRKYGVNNFIFEIIEETDNPSVKEQYWIKKLNTYHYGYNATLGGEGKQLYDHDKVLSLYNQGLTKKQLYIEKTY